LSAWDWLKIPKKLYRLIRKKNKIINVTISMDAMSLTILVKFVSIKLSVLSSYLWMEIFAQMSYPILYAMKYAIEHLKTL
jgi:hypothetical protein